MSKHSNSQRRDSGKYRQTITHDCTGDCEVYHLSSSVFSFTRYHNHCHHLTAVFQVNLS